MRLLSYHIENYGKIHNQDGSFDAGLTEFCEANGHGKTTLASFLCAMFYGLAGYKSSKKETKKDESFVERKHFYPFEGGKFGGSLTFEKDGKIYRIERFFDKQYAKDDEVKVYCEGVPYDGFGESIGEKVFGLDENSFKKTIFISEAEVDIRATDSINENLGYDIGGRDDMKITPAIEKLTDAKKELRSKKPKYIPTQEKKIAEIKGRIKNLEKINNALKEKYNQRDALQKDIEMVKNEIAQATRVNEILGKWERLEEYKAELEEKQGVIKGFEEKYPQGVPTEQECKMMQNCIEEETHLSGLLQGVKFSEDKEKYLAELTAKFQNGVPRDEDINQKQRRLNELTPLNSNLDELQTAQKDARQKDLERRFEDNLPTKEELENAENLADGYRIKEAELESLNETTFQDIPVQQKQGGKGKLLCVALAVACLIGGVVLFGQSLTAGAALLGIGALLFVVGILFSSNKTQTVAQSNDIHTRRAALQGEIKFYREKLHAFTVRYGCYGNAGVLYDFETLKKDIAEYKELVSARERNLENIKKIQEEVKAITSEVQAFLWSYGERGEDLQNGLNRLRTMANDYRSLQKDKADACEKASNLNRQIEQYKNTLLEMLKKYGLSENVGTGGGLSDLKDDCKEWEKTKKDCSAIEGKIEKYQTENGLTERPENVSYDRDMLERKKADLDDELAICKGDIDGDEREVAELSELMSELEIAEEKLKEYEDKWELIGDTINALDDAYETWKKKYIAPIKNQFSKYAEALERVLDEKVSMDSDYCVTFERGGENRSDKHLSAGERTLCALCVRLALIDNMYKTEQPFIIMDDPFVHLDKTHIERTAKLLQDLAGERQILYFCCHESRSMQNKM